MCCIFTCCGWLVDLMQRLWTFTMSCCISSAVCCALITACMSGVALGYNYSLAEYIDLKETNVSVYLKRGVFDDEVVDEMDWRRSGGGPPPAPERRSNLVGGAGGGGQAPARSRDDIPVRDFPFGSRRAGDEGIFATTTEQPNDLYSFESNDHHRFEGSLLKFTGNPLFLGLTSTHRVVTEDPEMASIMTSYPKDSVEQMKAVQGLVNRRKMLYGAAADTGQLPVDLTPVVKADASPPNLSQESNNPMSLLQNMLNSKKESALKAASHANTERPHRKLSLPPFLRVDAPNARRMGEGGGSTAYGDYLLAGESNPPKWYEPKLPTQAGRRAFDMLGNNPDPMKGLIIPAPSTPRPGRVKPSRHTLISFSTTTAKEQPNLEMGYRKAMDPPPQQEDEPSDYADEDLGFFGKFGNTFKNASSKPNPYNKKR